jgi:PAS domain S-box-containing protein
MSSISQETSCYSSSLLIKYALQNNYNTKLLFNGILDKKELLENPHEWIDFATWIQLAKNIENLGGDLFKAGIDITKNQISNFQLFFLKVASLPFILKNYSKQYQKEISSLIVLTIEQKNTGELDVIFTPKDRSKYSSQICEFNRGCTFAAAEMKHYRNIQLSEITCAARSNASECRYHITWTPSPPIFERLNNFFHFSIASQKEILAHMEETHLELQSQYREILSMRDFYSNIMEAMSESVVWLDKNGSIDFINKSFLALTGIEEEESRGKRFSDFLFNDRTVEEYDKLMQQCLANPLEPQNAEFLFRGSNNERKFGQISIIWVPSEHRASGYLITIRDITEKKIIEQQLYSAKDKYRALYENSPAIVIGLDINGKFIYANPAMVEQSGYSEEELKTMNFSQLIAPHADYNKNEALNALLNQPSRLQEVHFKTKPGEWKCITLTTYHIHDADKTLAGIAGIGVDITETKRLNEQLIKTQRMELLGQMAGGLAHDFNNILTSISGYSKLIITKSTEEKIKHYAETIDKAGIRASDLIKNLLSFSRGDVNKVLKFDINDIVKEIIELMVGIAKNIKFSAELPQNPVYLLGDPSKIHQSILNLCVNSKDAIGDKSGSIIIRVKNADTKKEYVWVQVEDTGSGIPPEIIDKIFDPFFTTKAKKMGTGLGLSVVYGMIKAHKGNIYVDSRPGEGTTFTIELPIFFDECSKATDSRKTILVIDNDDLPRNYCMEILLNSGYKVMDFSRVKDAEAWLRNNANQAWFAVSDMIMPDMDSKEFIATCQAIKKDFICIWMGSQTNLKMTEIAKTRTFLKKPFTPTDLIETIKSLKIPQ